LQGVLATPAAMHEASTGARGARAPDRPNGHVMRATDCGGRARGARASPQQRAGPKAAARSSRRNLLRKTGRAGETEELAGYCKKSREIVTEGEAE